LLRRRRLPAHLEAAVRELRAIVATLDEAARALTACAPSSRLAGRPLAEGLGEFEGRLREALELMPRWRRTEVDSEWAMAEAALLEALGRAERLRTDGEEPVGFEALIGAIDHLVAPLEVFDDVAAAFKRFRH